MPMSYLDNFLLDIFLWEALLLRCWWKPINNYLISGSLNLGPGNRKPVGVTAICMGYNASAGQVIFMVWFSKLSSRF